MKKIRRNKMNKQQMDKQLFFITKPEEEDQTARVVKSFQITCITILL